MLVERSASTKERMVGGEPLLGGGRRALQAHRHQDPPPASEARQLTSYFGRNGKNHRKIQYMQSRMTKIGAVQSSF